MKKKFLVGAIGLLLVCLGIFGWIVVTQREANTQTTVTQTATQSGISFSSDGKEVTYTGQASKTALALLQSLTEVQTKESQYGTMVTGIHGVQAEDAKTYWAFYVNDTYANEGAGTYVTKATDRLTWKLETIQ